MPTPKPGKLLKQGPIATLSGFSFNDDDRFICNGQQFVRMVAQQPKVVKASACKALYVDGSQIVHSDTYDSFKDTGGNFRFVNGSPTYDGVYTGWPGNYDHIIIGYETSVTTTRIKLWTIDYIPTDYIRVDYSHDDGHYYSAGITTTSFEFDDTLRLYSNERTPRGLYAYTITLDASYTGRYWRIRSFLYDYIQERIAADITGKDVTIASTAGWPDYGSFKRYLGTKTISHVNADFYPATFDGDIYCEWGDGIVVGYCSTPFGKSYNYTVVSQPIYDRAYSTGLNSVRIENLRFSRAIVGTFYKTSIEIYLKRWRTELREYWTERWDETLGRKVPLLWGYAPVTFKETKTIGSVTIDTEINKPTSSVLVVPFVDAAGYLPSTLQQDAGEWSLVCKMSYVTSREYDMTVFYSYSSKTSTKLETIDVDSPNEAYSLEAGTGVLYSYDMKIAQAQICEQANALFKFWESDGDVCSVKEINASNIYDGVFDASDNAYYLAVFNPSGGSFAGMSDTFVSGTANTFDSNKWSIEGSAFYLDFDASSLVFENTENSSTLVGALMSNAYHTNSFSDVVSVALTTISGSDYFGLTAIDRINSNSEAGAFVSGYDPHSYIGVSLSNLYDATDGECALRNFRFRPYELPEFSHLHKLTYEEATNSWAYTRVATGASYSPNITGSDSILFNSDSAVLEGMSFSLDKTDRLNDGSYISFYTTKATVSGAISDSFDLKLTYDVGSGSLSTYYDEGGGYIGLTSTSAISNQFKMGILGSSKLPVSVSGTGFVSNGTCSIDIPTVSVYAYNSSGERQAVTGVSDVNGIVLGSLDVFRSSAVEYSDFYGRISIATTGQSEAAGGSLFIRVGSDIYKYNKTTLPILSAEDGTHAAILASGVLPERNIYNFSYDGYGNGGLSYVEYDSDRGGIFLKTISSATLVPTVYETELDVSSAAVPLGYDATDLCSLYTVSGTSVYIFNMDASSVSFCDLSVSDPIIPANSESTSTVTAFVTNIFGEPLSNKTVAFSISLGDGSLSPATACTTSSGTASSVYTSGASTGNVTIVATASNDAC